ncbi:unnamed protein product [Clonostachys rosea f. rosea IK726]|uniref:Uncharacterized protein n=1 Tax=Clonostachys rosea f. rosea IK726 TaxID=1349383 RepID=A0ACA9U3N4_BIOOC|nr:unnamed protein product [Clonostachys rosea f. rosea IK726]
MKTPKRAFGTEISANRQRGCQFSPEQKAAMCAELWAGKTYRAVAEEYNTTASTAYGIFKRWQNTRSFDIAPRSGRPPKLTPAEAILGKRLELRYRRINRGDFFGRVNGTVRI